MRVAKRITALTQSRRDAETQSNACHAVYLQREGAGLSCAVVLRSIDVSEQKKLFLSPDCASAPLRLCVKIWILLISLVSSTSIALAGAEKIPPLEPPKGELAPTFWEAHGWAVACGAVALFVVVELCVLWFRRPREIQMTPPDILARRALEALRGAPENDELLVKLSRLLRWYVIHSLGLPPVELTTADLRRTLQSTPTVGAELTLGITEFLRQCDECKFSPTPPSPPKGAVATALEWMDKLDRHRKQQEAVPRPPAVEPPAMVSTHS
jgi:hypothetical protein